MRKKARLTSLQTRVSELRSEGSALTSALQDCFTANLLMGLSTDPDSGDEQSLSSMSSWDAEHDDSSVTKPICSMIKLRTKGLDVAQARSPSGCRL